MVTARRGGGKVTRDSLRFKPVSYDIPKDSTKEEDDEDLNLNMSSTFDKPSIQWNNNTKINAYTQIRTRSRKQKKTQIPLSESQAQEPAENKPHKASNTTVQKRFVTIEGSTYKIHIATPRKQ